MYYYSFNLAYSPSVYAHHGQNDLGQVLSKIISELRKPFIGIAHGANPLEKT